MLASHVLSTRPLHSTHRGSCLPEGLQACRPPTQRVVAAGNLNGLACGAAAAAPAANASVGQSTQANRKFRSQHAAEGGRQAQADGSSNLSQLSRGEGHETHGLSKTEQLVRVRDGRRVSFLTPMDTLNTMVGLIRIHRLSDALGAADPNSRLVCFPSYDDLIVGKDGGIVFPETRNYLKGERKPNSIRFSIASISHFDTPTDMPTITVSGKMEADALARELLSRLQAAGTPGVRVLASNKHEANCVLQALIQARQQSMQWSMQEVGFALQMEKVKEGQQASSTSSVANSSIYANAKGISSSGNMGSKNASNVAKQLPPASKFFGGAASASEAEPVSTTANSQGAAAVPANVSATSPEIDSGSPSARPPSVPEPAPQAANCTVTAAVMEGSVNVGPAPSSNSTTADVHTPTSSSSSGASSSSSTDAAAAASAAAAAAAGSGSQSYKGNTLAPRNVGTLYTFTVVQRELVTPAVDVQDFLDLMGPQADFDMPSSAAAQAAAVLKDAIVELARQRAVVDIRLRPSALVLSLRAIADAMQVLRAGAMPRATLLYVSAVGQEQLTLTLRRQRLPALLPRTRPRQAGDDPSSSTSLASASASSALHSYLKTGRSKGRWNKTATASHAAGADQRHGAVQDPPAAAVPLYPLGPPLGLVLDRATPAAISTALRAYLTSSGHFSVFASTKRALSSVLEALVVAQAQFAAQSVAGGAMIGAYGGTAAGAGMPGVALLPERQLVSTGVGRGAAMKEQLVLHVLDPNEYLEPVMSGDRLRLQPLSGLQLHKLAKAAVLRSRVMEQKSPASALLRLYLDEEGVLQAVVEPYIVTTRGSAAAASSKASSSPAASDASDEPAADDGASSREAGTSLAVAGDSDPTALARAIVAEVKKTFFSAAQEEAASSTSTRSEKGGSASGPRPGHALDTGVTLLLGGGRPADTMRTASLAVAMALLQVQEATGCVLAALPINLRTSVIIGEEATRMPHTVRQGKGRNINAHSRDSSRLDGGSADAGAGAVEQQLKMKFKTMWQLQLVLPQVDASQ